LPFQLRCCRSVGACVRSKNEQKKKGSEEHPKAHGHGQRVTGFVLFGVGDVQGTGEGVGAGCVFLPVRAGATDGALFANGTVADVSGGTGRSTTDGAAVDACAGAAVLAFPTTGALAVTIGGLGVTDRKRQPTIAAPPATSRTTPAIHALDRRRGGGGAGLAIPPVVVRGWVEKVTAATGPLAGGSDVIE
jgi:hypothetical protein